MRSYFLRSCLLALGLLVPMAVVAATKAKTSQRYELMGVIADGSRGDQRRSVALIKDTGNHRAIFARLGDEIAPGKRVLRIAAKQVVIGPNLSMAENILPAGWPTDSDKATSTDESVPYFGSNGERPSFPPPNNVPMAPPYDPNNVPPAYDPNMPPPTYDPNQAPVYDPNQVPPDQHVFNPPPYYPNDGLHNAVPGNGTANYDNWQDPNFGQQY